MNNNHNSTLPPMLLFCHFCYIIKRQKLTVVTKQVIGSMLSANSQWPNFNPGDVKLVVLEATNKVNRNRNLNSYF